MMKRRYFFLILFFFGVICLDLTAVDANPDRPYVNSGLYAAFNQSEWVDVGIILRNMSEAHSFVASFSNETFKLERISSQRITARITEDAFQKMVEDSRIKSMYQNFTMSSSEEVHEIEPPAPSNNDAIANRLLITLVVFSPLLFIPLLIVLGLKLRGNSRAHWIFATIAAVYSFIPHLGAMFYSGAGDPGPYYLFLLPLFWPLLAINLIGALIFLPIFHVLNITPDSIDPIVGVIFNIFIWALIGYGIGSRIKRARVKSKN